MKSFIIALIAVVLFSNITLAVSSKGKISKRFIYFFHHFLFFTVQLSMRVSETLFFLKRKHFFFFFSFYRESFNFHNKRGRVIVRLKKNSFPWHFFYNILFYFSKTKTRVGCDGIHNACCARSWSMRIISNLILRELHSHSQISMCFLKCVTCSSNLNH